ncbi:hypothetical protein MIR68_012278 [Amoeboaphelidium protococcarum]|nr:hypothetical protein MIR68_012278 [Amoeboaphelidium protococcarum]
MKKVQCPLNGISGYSIQFSPYNANDFIVCGGSNFGISGSGAMSLYRIDQSNTIGGGGYGQISLLKSVEFSDCVFDCRWSELSDGHMLAACGDGSVVLVDMSMLNVSQTKVIMRWQEHIKEVFCVDWSSADKSKFLSSSWDGSVKVYDVNSPQSIGTYQLNVPASGGGSGGQQMPVNDASIGCIYSAKFSPHNPHIFLSCAGPPVLAEQQSQYLPPIQYTSSDIVMIDMRIPPSEVQSVVCRLPSPHMGGEVLDLDWNKYDNNLIASVGTGANHSVCIWDMRMLIQQRQAAAQDPFMMNMTQNSLVRAMPGHQLPARRVKWSPHKRNVVASVGYDMTLRVWNTSMEVPCIYTEQSHSEFVFGVDFNLFKDGEIATCSWDQSALVQQLTI